MKNEKPVAETTGYNTTMKLITMKNNTPSQNINQSNLLSGASCDHQQKILQIITRCDCHQNRPLDGYRFKLMPLCSDSRTQNDLKVLAKRIERRSKR